MLALLTSHRMLTVADVQERVVGGFGIPSPLPATKGGAWEAGYEACLQVEAGQLQHAQLWTNPHCLMPHMAFMQFSSCRHPSAEQSWAARHVPDAG